MNSAAEQEISDTAQLAREPLVSVLVLTYNHEAYLEEAVRSVAQQRCGFPFEIIIGEDCSRDATRAVALRLQQAYPGLVRLIVSQANVGAAANLRRIAARVRGRYVAFCEGDDSWHGQDRLAAQVAALQAAPQAVLVHTDWVRSRFDGQAWQVDWRHTTHAGLRPALLAGDAFNTFYFSRAFRTCTIVYRRDIVDGCLASVLGRGDYGFMDTVLAAYGLAQGPAAYLARVGAVYRESPGSLLRSGPLARLRYLQACLAFDTAARAFFAARGGYPDGYRWEQSFGLLLKSLLSGKWDIARQAAADLYRHYGLLSFLRCGWRALDLRRRRRRWQAQRLALFSAAADTGDARAGG
jgi:Glycosyl transferase family 2